LVLGAVRAVIRRSTAETPAPEIEVLREQARRAARSDISVLILGETGAGKEVLARYIHEASPRAAGPFVALHCAALSDSLLEAELFGHEKGAFTGASMARPGLFEAANGGTVLLDEIGEIPASTQVKLLRVLEERAVMRLGARMPTPVDVRFLAATHRDLEVEVERGAFREDLFYRIAGLTLTVPSLRERRAEIATLARAFLEDASRRMGRPSPPTLSPASIEAMLRHPWPGNVREMKNAMERAAVLADGMVVLPEHLPPRVVAKGARETNRPVPKRADTGLTTLDQINTAKKALERQCVEEALDACGGNQTRAAMQLGISRRALVTKIEAYGLTRPRKRD
jgi:two-component system, NtrC family, response regulator AtoC